MTAVYFYALGLLVLAWVVYDSGHYDWNGAGSRGNWIGFAFFFGPLVLPFYLSRRRTVPLKSQAPASGYIPPRRPF